ncbi:hypothetical protein KP509_31G014600 [Ceratopteris richardii]|uniref:phosphoethanolamine N-methyltransferase n=1 Tax=Ceratopteris richardii TaxID=49495 RepID=A0A8T2QXJ1_CERRI|nr:hypothetical protein KP509_31G014600 [Ceratopteris richardii]
MILSSLPPIKGKSILELGAGIGTFTGELAKHVAHVIACDFMENAIEKNEEINLDAEFICADTTSDEDLHIRPNSIDLIFLNSLLMHFFLRRKFGLFKRKKYIKSLFENIRLRSFKVLLFRKTMAAIQL